MIDVDALRVLVIAPLAGAILGLPAEFRRRPAGIRTHALVSLGAAVFGLTGIAALATAESDDPLRAIQGIASGVGFIGAASILKGGDFVRGINTAASVWIAAAVGTAIAFARTPAVGLLAAIFGTIINWALMGFEERVFHVSDEAESRGQGAGGSRD